MNYVDEKTTRKKLIDEGLKKSGWLQILPFSEALDPGNLDNVAITEYPTESGPADYVLISKGKPIAIVEAKKLTVGPQNVLSQAQRYARGIADTGYEFNGYKVPFIFSSSGEVIWFQDLRSPLSRSRQIEEFYRPTALIELLTSNFEQGVDWLKHNPPTSQKLRDYQKDAIAGIEKAIGENKRSMLVAMATGTGKTYTVASLIYRLLKSKTSKRVLFLVDRKALAAQAVTEFASFEAENNLKFNQIYQVYSQRFQRNFLDENDKFDFNVLPTSYLTNPDGTEAFVYVCTIQRMRINLFGSEGMFPWSGEEDQEEGAEKLDIPINAFDTIIADECHRGYTSQEVSKWREVLNHFDAIKIGLTATPAAHTTSFFKDIVYRYTYEQAVKDGYLVDYDAVKVESGVRIKGITLTEGEEVENVNPETGVEQLDLLEDEKHFDVTDVERNITSPDSNRKVIQEFAKYALDQEKATGHFPKTLIFADNDLAHISHADQLVDICRDVFNRGDAFVQKITGSPSVDRPLQRIREFRNRPDPAIVVTVDMLSTGVDVPTIENIIFLRPVKSRILFEQMMGRGTRLCPAINKSHFTVFDCFGGTLLEAFKKSTGITQDAPLTSTRTMEQIINELNNNTDTDYNVRCLVKRFQRIAKEISAEGKQALAKYIPDGDIGRFAQDFPERFTNDRVEAIKPLTNKGLVNLLVHYPRPPRKFIKVLDQEDTVSSEYLFRTSDGRELKPNDYIAEFEKFIRENPEHIEAIRIILQKPKDWSTGALKELRKDLSQHPDNFTEDKLRKAYKYPLADIISLVKHAAKDEPILSAKERIDLAIEKMTQGKRLTTQQEQWLGLIKQHLATNLTIDPEDFDTFPIFTDRGGSFAKIDREFDNKLGEYIKEINTYIPSVYAYPN